MSNKFGPTYTGFHILMEQKVSWSWEPCDPENGPPCTAESDEEALDFQGIVTHEWGHVFGLDHTCGQDGRCDASEMTMKTGRPARHKQTLALGDILGVRWLYPTDAPMPTIYRP